jgi:Fic family protein
MEPLLAKAHDLARLATTLAGTRVPPELRSLLRHMNSYYTNRIEGQHTRPHEIDQALRQDFSKDAALAAKQRLAVAHIAAEQALEQRYSGTEGARALYAVDAVQDIHRALLGHLPAGDLFTSEQEPIPLGTLRQQDVRVGQHVAPAHASVPMFLARWCAFYGGVRRGEAALVALACAHQRLGWVHPFVDGNGRVMRLHTHTWLMAQGYTGGLWSPLRWARWSSAGCSNPTRRKAKCALACRSTHCGFCSRSCGRRQRRMLPISEQEKKGSGSN